MNITPRVRFYLRLQHTGFVVLLLAAMGLLAWLSTRYGFEADWTADRRHTLSDTSRALLGTLPGPLTITAYASPDATLRESIGNLVERYRREKSDISLRFVDPAAAPAQVRDLEITQDGELIVEYQGRSEHLVDLTEQDLTQALQRVARKQQRWVAFLEGHGERSPLGQANHDLGFWAQTLKSRGINAQPLNLAATPEVPDNVAVLVIAGPRLDLLPAEVEVLKNYLDKGGNLLWLLDPGPWHSLGPLAGALGLDVPPGVIVDPASDRLLGLMGAGASNPGIVLITQYGAHPITRNLPQGMLALLPEAAPLRVTPPEPWKAAPLLNVHDQAWAENGALDKAEFSEGQDARGPFTVGVALTREQERAEAGGETVRHEQRVVVIGDGDFLSNTYLENSGNLDLGVKIVDWLAQDEDLLSVPARVPSDQSLDLSPLAGGLMAFGFLLALPLGLLGIGVAIWFKRRK